MQRKRGDDAKNNKLYWLFSKDCKRTFIQTNFINYTYRQEMISDGENCLQYIHNFNPEKSKILLHTLHK